MTEPLNEIYRSDQPAVFRAKFDLRQARIWLIEVPHFASKKYNTANAYIRPGGDPPVSAKLLSARM